MICSLPSCTAEAVLQWQRLASAAENTGVDQSTVTQEHLDLDADLRRAAHKRIMRELEAARPDVHPDRHAALDAQIAREQAAHDAVVATILPERTAEPNLIAVFACAQHAVEDTATHLHEAHCLTTERCACRTLDPAAV